MKKLLSILLAALCALLPMLALAQESTTIQTTVPAEHTITIVCGSGGSVVITGSTYAGTLSVKVPRLGSLTLTARPDEGFGLTGVYARQKDGLTVEGGEITLSSVHADNTLTLDFGRLPEVQPTQTPEATPTAAPQTPADGLYDGYLGAGEGDEQLSIVFDGEYQPQDYEWLSVEFSAEAQGNVVRVRAFEDEEGKTARRSLILSLAQLTRLAQERQIERLIFENGEALAEVTLADLLAEEIAGGEESARIEVRILPVELTDGGTAYEFSVWRRAKEQEAEVSALLPSLRVCLAADEAQDGGLTWRAQADGDFLPLESSLCLLPEEPQEQEAAERFLVAMSREGGAPRVEYEANVSPALCRKSVWAASYAGGGQYAQMSAASAR